MLVFFDDERCADVALAGGKGASLARMTALGMPVPPGFVVPASALEAALADTVAAAFRRARERARARPGRHGARDPRRPRARRRRRGPRRGGRRGAGARAR